MEYSGLSKWWLRGIAFLLAASPPAVVLWLQDSLAPYVAALSPVVLLRIGVVLLLTATSLGALFILQRPWLQWHESTGTWLSRLTGFRYCAKCRAGKIVTPLKNEVTGWRCMHCQHFFVDPIRAKKEKVAKAGVVRERI